VNSVPQATRAGVGQWQLQAKTDFSLQEPSFKG
jgi:hypothetical protein